MVTLQRVNCQYLKVWFVIHGLFQDANFGITAPKFLKHKEFIPVLG